jgi:endoglucanase
MPNRIWIFCPLAVVVISGCLGLSATAGRTTPPPGKSGETKEPDPAPTQTVPAPPAAGERPDAPEMNRRLGRGVNFGDALEAPAEGEWGVTLQADYFQLVKDAGFQTIRLPIRWNTHAAETAPFTIDPSFFTRIDWAVENALSRNLNVILDFHHFAEYMDCPACERDRFLGLWEQIADHYRAAPPEVLFELLNEPTDAVPAAEWNGALADALAVIRRTNPYRTVVVGPVGWNGLTGLAALDLPADDRGLIVTLHYYNPFPFTHQGAGWVTGSDAWLGTVWTGDAAETRAIRADFAVAAEWGRAHGRPIFLGEFGAYERAGMDSRARWTAAVVQEAEADAFSWAYWEFCSGFGVYDREKLRWRDPLLRALLPDSPLLA